MIPGIRSLDQMWESGLYNEGKYEYHHVIGERQAFEGMLTLIRKMGVLCGPSAGANYAGAVSYLKTIDEDLSDRKSAVFIICDRMEWYLSYIKDKMPELFGEEAKPGSLFNFQYNSDEISPGLKAEDLDTYLKEKSPLVIDTRAPVAYGMDHINGSINIPIDQFERLIDNAEPFPKDKPILLLCAVGEKTKRLSAYLATKGYDTNNLEGGMLAVKKYKAQNPKAA